MERRIYLFSVFLYIRPLKNVPKWNKAKNVHTRNIKHNKKRLAGQDTSLDAFKGRLQAFLLVRI